MRGRFRDSIFLADDAMTIYVFRRLDVSTLCPLQFSSQQTRVFFYALTSDLTPVTPSQQLAPCPHLQISAMVRPSSKAQHRATVAANESRRSRQRSPPGHYRDVTTFTKTTDYFSEELPFVVVVGKDGVIGALRQLDGHLRNVYMNFFF